MYICLTKFPYICLYNQYKKNKLTNTYFFKVIKIKTIKNHYNYLLICIKAAQMIIKLDKMVEEGMATRNVYILLFHQLYYSI